MTSLDDRKHEGCVFAFHRSKSPDARDDVVAAKRECAGNLSRQTISSCSSGIGESLTM
jgi:hypothetical protein